MVKHDSKDFKFDAAQIEKSLAQNSDFNLKSFNKVEVDIEYSIMSFHAEIEYKEAIFNVDLYISDTKNINLNDYGFANAIDEESL